MKRIYILNIFLFALIFSAKAHEHQKSKQSLIKFTENKNQWEDFIKYKAQLDGGALFLQNNRLTYHFYEKEVLRSMHANPNAKFREVKTSWFHVNFKDANANPTIISKTAYPNYDNYFIGNDKSKWASNVWSYKELVYENLWNGINLQLLGNDNSLKYNLFVAPHVNPNIIKLEYEGVKDIQLKDGKLIISSSINEMTEHAPYAYQIINGKEVEVVCKFKLDGTVLSYVFPKGYNINYELVIDPVLVFACSSGSTEDNFGMTATYDEQGNLYSGGTVFGVGFPTVNAYDASYNSIVQYGITDVVITKYDASGTFLQYSTYLGGSANGTEVVNSLVVDAQNNLYAYGVTSSNNFPMVNAYDPTFNGGQRVRFVNNGAFFESGADIYIAKLSPGGNNLLGSTYIGGTGNDGINCTERTNAVANIAPYGIVSEPVYDSLFYNYGDQNRGEILIDGNGDVIVASCTKSNDFPIINGFDNTLNGKQDGVVFKLSNTLTNLIWSTYIGGSSSDAANAINHDSANNVFVTGGTSSNNLSGTTGAFNATYNGGKTDGFVAKISPDGTQLMAATYIGTTSYDACHFVQLDRNDNVYVLGQSQGNMAAVNVNYFNSNGKIFITKFNNSLSTRIFQTIIGNGTTNITLSPSAFLVDVCENIYFSGWGGNFLSNTATFNMPLQNPTQSSNPDGYNFYLMALSPNSNSILYGSYFGGASSQEHVDGGTSRFDKKGIIYQSVCAGCGGNDDFPVTAGSWPRSLYGSNINQSTNCNNGTFKLNFQIPIAVANFTTTNLEGCSPLTVTFNNQSIGNNYLWDFGNNDTTSQIFNPTQTFSSPGTYNVFLYVVDSSRCNIRDTASIVVNVYDSPTMQATATTVACSNTFNFNNTSTAGTALTYGWNFGDNTTSTNQNPSHTYSGNGSYTVSLIATDTKGCKDTLEIPVQIALTPDTVGLGNSYCADSIVPVQLFASGGTTYSWDPPVGLSNPSISNPVANPTTSTIYSVTITELDASSNVCSSVKTVTVTVNPIVTANFDPATVPCSNTFTFNDLTQGNVASWQWDFGDNTTSNLQSPSHTYAANGSYTVNLIVSSAQGCNDTIQLPVQIALTPDSVGLGAIYCSDSIVPIQLYSNGGTTYSWLPVNGLSDPAIANPIASPSVTTIYTVTISELDFDGNTCASTKTLSIDVHPEVMADFNPAIQPCSNTFDFGNLSSGPINTWLWDFGDDSTSILQAPTHTYAGNGDYIVTLVVTSAQGCNDTVFIPVKIDLHPDTIGPGAIFCADNILPVPLFADGGVTYAWSPALGLTDTTIANPIAIPDQTTTYSVTITEYDFGGNACASTQTVTIQIKPGVTADFTFTADPCNNTFQFNDASFGNVSSWAWDFGDSNSSTTQSPSHTYAAAGTYPVNLIIQNAEGCNDTISTPVFLGSFGPVTVSGPQTICFGQQAQLNASGGVAYQWVPSSGLSNPNVANPIANPNTTTNYSVIITTVSSIGDSCSRELTTGITVPALQPNQLVTSANPDTIYAGDFSNLSSNIGPPLTILWSPLYQLSSITDYNPTASPLHTTTYAAVAEDANGCKFLLDSVTIYVLSRYCDESTVYVPNTFTPNGDGANDVLYVRSNFITQIYFAVYNRWGELVFETTDLSKGWDGMYKGMKVDPGVFGYYLRYDCTNDLKGFKKGNVTLIR